MKKVREHSSPYLDDQIRCLSKNTLFFKAVDNWLANPRKHGVIRDIGESLDATEYEDDLNLQGTYEGAYSDDEDDLNFINDSSLSDSMASSRSDSDTNEPYSSVHGMLTVENDIARSSASASHSTDFLRIDGMTKAASNLTHEVEVAQEPNSGNTTAEGTETEDITAVSISVQPMPILFTYL